MVANIGLDNGKMIRIKIWNGVAPSIIAASSNASGIDSKKDFIINILKIESAPGTVTAHIVFIQPNDLINK